MQQKEIKITINGSYEIASLIISENELTFKYDNHSITKKGDYLFMILKEIRQELERKNIFLLINGSRRDVYPSGISLMGTNAYVQTLGQGTSGNDLVDIFDGTDDFGLIGTVEDQQKYHNDWINSLLSLK